MFARGCGFLATISVGPKLQGFSPYSKRIENAALFLDTFSLKIYANCNGFPACFRMQK
jgi:hypothetical protein